jgi:hypothetical protein
LRTPIAPVVVVVVVVVGWDAVCRVAATAGVCKSYL